MNQTTSCAPSTQLCGGALSFFTTYSYNVLVVVDDKTKFALITGGSEGVGFAIAEMFVRHGWQVGLVARRLEKLEAARAELQKNNPAAVVEIFSGDVTDTASIEALKTAVQKITPQLDALVNSAGTFRWDNELGGLDLMALNATSKKTMLEVFENVLASEALVVNVSSIAALFKTGDPRLINEEFYVKSMQAVDELSAEFQTAHPDLRVYVAHPPLMKGNIAEQQFRGRPGFEDIDFANLPGPEIVAQEIEKKFFI